MKQKTLILGGGIAGLSFAYFHESESVILEKESVLGGLSRSFFLNGIAYDIGPHIIFSKHQDILDLHTSLIPVNKIRRSNKILYQGKLIKYPFENDLAALTPAERDYCLVEFLNNPYENYQANNMQQFFLKTFGEGITRLYLQPYNEKIWKFDPACLDTQMVERIPKPPKEDVIKSAEGVATEGYVHQLYFSYPQSGGFQTLVNAYADKIQHKTQIHLDTEIHALLRENDQWAVVTNHGTFHADSLINTMPLHELFKYLNPPKEITESLNNLKYNSIHIVVAQFKQDTIGDNFALYIPDKDIIFHRLSKLNFLGDAYSLPDNQSTLMMEITFRPGSYLANLSEDDIKQQVLAGLEKLHLAKRDDLLAIELQTFKYAYVIYDLDHRANTNKVLAYLKEQNIFCCGRFAEFEYMNSDQVVFQSKKLALSAALVNV